MATSNVPSGTLVLADVGKASRLAASASPDGDALVALGRILSEHATAIGLAAGTMEWPESAAKHALDAIAAAQAHLVGALTAQANPHRTRRLDVRSTVAEEDGSLVLVRKRRPNVPILSYVGDVPSRTSTMVLAMETASREAQVKAMGRKRLRSAPTDILPRKGASQSHGGRPNSTLLNVHGKSPAQAAGYRRTAPFARDFETITSSSSDLARRDAERRRIERSK